MHGSSGAFFGSAQGARLFFSPGRINLMGAHLDYNGGPVMPTAVDRGTFLAVRPRRDRRVVFASTLEESRPLEIELDALPPERLLRWSDYPLGVLIEMGLIARARGREKECTGLEVLFGGNLPVGAGLSSSASICVGTAFALESMWHLGLERMDLVDAALRAERGFVGVQCGIMDPYAVGLARANSLLWLDCKDRTHSYLPLDTQRLSIGVADSLVRRELAQRGHSTSVWRSVARLSKSCRVVRPTRGVFATCTRDVDRVSTRSCPTSVIAALTT